MKKSSIEIELKFPLLNYSEIICRLNEIAIFKYESQQVDYYYNAPHRDFVKNPQNINEWLRLRVSNDKVELNYKDWQPHNEIIKTYCKEYEIKVSSFEGLQSILEALNFKPLITVDKLRKVWLFNEVEISIDFIADLGAFIELEYKGNSDNIEKVRELLFQTLSSTGAQTSEIDLKGYPFLMLKRNGFFNK